MYYACKKNQKNKDVYLYLMTIFKAIKFFTLTVFIFATMQITFAQDRQMLDKLVTSDVISQTEASKIAKDLALVFPQKGSGIKTSVWGFAQLMYNYMYSETTHEEADDWGGFSLRKVYMGFVAEIPENWKVALELDFCKRNSSGSDYILNCYISKKLDLDFTSGTLHFGFKKVQMGYEEIVGTFGISTVDTSIVSRYFLYSQNNSSIGMGSRYTGLFWDGTLRGVEGFKYHLAVTGSMNNTLKMHTHLSNKDYNPTNANNVNLWAAFFYTKKLYEDFKITLGAKTGFGNQAFIVSDDKYGSIFQVNPFIEVRYQDKFIGWFETIISNIEYGSANRQSYATPIGYNLNAEYFFLDTQKYGKVSFVSRLSQIFTDGKGIIPKDVLTDAKAPSHPRPMEIYFDRATTIYAGICWYIFGNDFKFFAGYEYAKFDNPVQRKFFGDVQTDMHILRAQINLRF